MRRPPRLPSRDSHPHPARNRILFGAQCELVNVNVGCLRQTVAIPLLPDPSLRCASRAHVWSHAAFSLTLLSLCVCLSLSLSLCAGNHSTRSQQPVARPPSAAAYCAACAERRPPRALTLSHAQPTGWLCVVQFCCCCCCSALSRAAARSPRRTVVL